MILYPLRHCGAVYQAEILGAASGAKMADIKQGQQMIPFITCEIPCSKYLRVGFWCQCNGFEFWVQMNLVKQPIQSNSVGS